MPSRPIVAAPSGTEPPPRPVFSGLQLCSFAPHTLHDGRLVMVRDSDWKLSVCLDPAVNDLALYNLSDDPYERRNLAADPAHAARRETMLALVEEHIATTSRR